MLDIDLMILFNGFIRNYVNLGLNKNSNNIEIIKQENKYFSTIGKLLGFSVVNKKNYNDINIEICWNEYELDTVSESLIKFQMFREIDLTKDLLAIHNLLNNIKENPNRGYIQILETSSNNRVDFLNNIVKTSIVSCTSEYLIIYITRDVIKNITYFNSYLFKGNEIIKNKIGLSSSDKEENLIANFKIH
ncbi:hypothetical protein [Clostridium nigeriense]|uniref:hypothetical protein n=1 Tax=Clostridium nigeriense TaxID=1805470 RepID=UPI00082A76EF|nr:hypothetical protein [Clostridium nigeriense]